MAQLEITPREDVTPQDGRVPGAGVELASVAWPGDDPVVAIHGLTAHSRNFAAIGSRLSAEHGRGLVAVDLRGRGDSDKPEHGYGMQAHADDVAAAMRHLGLGPSVVIGHSMGAYIATALAATHPDLVRGVLMLDGGYPQPAPPGVEFGEVLEQLLAPMLERLRVPWASRQQYVAFWRQHPAFPPSHWNQYVEEYVAYDLGGREPELRAKASETAVRIDFDDMCDQGRAGARLAALQCPLTLIRAEHGLAFGMPPIFTEDLAAYVRRHVRGAEDILVAGATHYTIAFSEPGLATTVAKLDEMARSTSR